MKKAISTDPTAANIARVLVLLDGMPARLERLSSGRTDEQLSQPLAAGERSPAQTLAHLVNSEAINAEFIYLALLRADLTYHDVHSEREYGQLLRHDLLPFGDLLAYFKFRRAALLRVLTSLAPGQWSRALSQAGKARHESVYWRARAQALHELEHVEALEGAAAPA